MASEVSFVRLSVLHDGRHNGYSSTSQYTQKLIFVMLCPCYYTPKSKKVALVDWRLVFGHSLLPVHSGERLLLGGSVRATVVVDRNISTSCSQYLRWRFMFVWNLGLSVEEAVYYLGVSTWSVERFPRRHQYLHKTQPILFIPRGSTKTIQRANWVLGA